MLPPKCECFAAAQGILTRNFDPTQAINHIKTARIAPDEAAAGGGGAAAPPAYGVPPPGAAGAALLDASAQQAASAIPQIAQVLSGLLAGGGGGAAPPPGQHPLTAVPTANPLVQLAGSVISQIAPVVSGMVPLPPLGSAVQVFYQDHKYPAGFYPAVLIAQTYPGFVTVRFDGEEQPHATPFPVGNLKW